MKLCPKCNLYKEPFEFNRNASKKDGLQSYCIFCRAALNREWYQQNKSLQKSRAQQSKRKLRNYIDNYLSTQYCIDCGTSDQDVLEFDHLYDKKFNISDAPRLGVGIERLKLEIDKCDIRCANCHRRKTKSERRGDYW